MHTVSESFHSRLTICRGVYFTNCIKATTDYTIIVVVVVVVCENVPLEILNIWMPLHRQYFRYIVLWCMAACLHSPFTWRKIMKKIVRKSNLFLVSRLNCFVFPLFLCVTFFPIYICLAWILLALFYVCNTVNCRNFSEMLWPISLTFPLVQMI